MQLDSFEDVEALFKDLDMEDTLKAKIAELEEQLAEKFENPSDLTKSYINLYTDAQDKIAELEKQLEFQKEQRKLCQDALDER